MVYNNWYIILREKIRKAKTDDELDKIIDEIYQKGCEDTEQEFNNDGEGIPWNDLD